jgi:hypothetical protein
MRISAAAKASGSARQVVRSEAGSPGRAASAGSATTTGRPAASASASTRLWVSVVEEKASTSAAR